jgi:hypothetical protein
MLINPKNYRFTLGATAELKCIVYDPGAPKGKDRMIPGRTIRIKIQRQNDNLYANFTTNTWGNGEGNEYETTMTDNSNGLYTMPFAPEVFSETSENTYTVLYLDKAESGDPTWGGVDYENLIFTENPFIPPNPSTVGYVVIYGWLINSKGEPIKNARVEAFATKEEIFHATEGKAIQRIVHSTKTDKNGYWELEVIPTEDIIPAETRYIFTFQRRDSYHAPIANTPVAQNFADLDFEIGWD